MPVQNTDVADIFNKVADLLDIQGANPFRIRAYRNAARSISSLPRNVSDMIEENYDLTPLAGIGEDLASKIREIVETGVLSQLEALEGDTPSELDTLMKVAGLGPKRVKALHQDLGIETLKELRKAAEKGKIHGIDGFGEKTEQTILEELQKAGANKDRIKLPEAEQRAEPLVAYLKKAKGIKEITVKDGSLDPPDEVMKELDLTVCAVHYHRNLSGERQTERIIRAMDNPNFNILAHPTGRLINERKPYDVDMEKIMEATSGRGCFLEINAQPDRLDLSDRYCKMAGEMKLKVVISTDAHSVTDLAFMRFGVDQARRGWLEAGDILNTRSWKQLKKMLRRK
jgi:DNA polymerase/3'-5' exonuclease PolX